ncbi:FAD/FMN-containing dehydrogenase [Halopolyspora algeriensis]|uniref:FAD/FMN-containing dehydrogenase n=1 Tax=Halopolyspora algeriensis TaxID=1500506 RepID=A0A368VR21_9ACTN|nr:FAD-binding oxidoreductase [Halopolyspora algeriensis]RCW44068.1 FAD/FMN-containing dehydrogenase [Halopolyspora algeriensis]TQM53433.1 FAD/FMN-containing dehydrogenase [Halopolyspora algeriensis]
MTKHDLHRTPIEQLRSRFDGAVLTPGDPGYEDARSLFNAMITARPRVIAQCEHARDVRAALEFARRHDLRIAVRSGGHSVAGASLIDEGLVIDMRRMNAVSVDPEARTVTVGGGAAWGDLDRATQPYHLVTTGGRVSTTGVAGLTLGGGSGWIERKYGLACDNLLSVDLVTADGREITAGEQENPELFWALHGGGGNFGVATSLTFRLHEAPEFAAALMIWPGSEGRRVAGCYRDFAERAPNEIGGGLVYVTGPPEQFVPENMVNTLCCMVLITSLGTESDLRERIEPLLDLHPAGHVITDIPYADLQCMLDDPPGYRNHWSAEYLRELPDEALDLFCARAQDMPVPSPSQHALLPWGGAVARESDSSAMANRDVPWVVHPLGLWENPEDDDAVKRWAHGLRDDLRQWSTGAVYLNFIGDEGADRVVAGYGRDNYARLSRIKAEYDPGNVFNRWHNVRPDPGVTPDVDVVVPDVIAPGTSTSDSGPSKPEPA